MIPIDDDGSFSGDFLVREKVYNAINEEATDNPRRETGGMLFGSFDESGASLTVSVEAVKLISEEAADRTASHFGINPEYADRVLNEYCPEYTYLGNWHSHLSYGGPSQGDYEQVSRFFETNQNRNLMIAVIMDRQSLNPPDFGAIIEVYQRAVDDDSGYRTCRVEEVRLSQSTYGEPDNAEVEAGELVEAVRTLDLRQVLVDRLLSLIAAIEDETEIAIDQSDAMAYITERGAGVEVILCLPITYYQQSESGTGTPQDFDVLTTNGGSNKFAAMDENETGEEPSNVGSTDIGVYLKLSIPANYPAGDIYIDLASRDLTKQLTLHTAPSTALDESLEEFVADINRGLTEHIPTVLSKPLASTMQTETGWSQ